MKRAKPSSKWEKLDKPDKMITLLYRLFKRSKNVPQETIK